MQIEPSAGDAPAPSPRALSDFQRALLPGTLRNAFKTAFYRERWGGIDEGDLARIELEDLPTVDKEDIRAAGTAAQNREGVVCNDVLTSGTMGDPLVTVRSNKEQRFIAEFFAHHRRADPTPSRIRGLEFTNPYHGHLIRAPSPIHFHSVSVYDAGSFDYGRRTLVNAHQDFGVDERCSVLVGLERCLRAFTYDTMLKHPTGLDGSKLRLVVSYSQYVTESWRRRYEAVWRAPLVDRFGISEVFGCAVQCLHCGWYHFEPFAIPEVFGARSRRLLREGEGLLALSALFPFQQAQPLVRYLTGDLVEVTSEASCRPGTVAIKPLGRARFGVPAPDGDDWLVSPASVLEAVEDVAEVARISRFGDVGQVTDPSAIGHPKYRTSWCRPDGRTQIRIEVAPLRSAEPARVRDALTGIADDVLRRNLRLRSFVRDGKATLDVVTRDDVDADLIAQAHSGGVWSRE